LVSNQKGFLVSESSRPIIGFIGAGRTANALAVGLSNAGYRVAAIASRDGASARELVARLPDARVRRVTL
jgi:predicted short-subunit dehydrogenase-like oxidoreductase (DUF2520 family)